MGYAYSKLAAAAATDTRPAGWPWNWPISSTAPLPPGFPGPVTAEWSVSLTYDPSYPDELMNALLTCSDATMSNYLVTLTLSQIDGPLQFKVNGIGDLVSSYEGRILTDTASLDILPDWENVNILHDLTATFTSVGTDHEESDSASVGGGSMTVVFTNATFQFDDMPQKLTATILLRGDNTDHFDGKNMIVSSKLDGVTVQLKTGGAYANTVAVPITNYSGSLHGFQENFSFDISGEGSLVVTAQLETYLPTISDTDTAAVTESAAISGFRWTIWGPAGYGSPPAIDPSLGKMVHFALEEYYGGFWWTVESFPPELSGRSSTLTFVKNSDSTKMPIKLVSGESYETELVWADTEDLYNAVVAGCGFLVISYEPNALYVYPGANFVYGIVMANVYDSSHDASGYNLYSYPYAM